MQKPGLREKRWRKWPLCDHEKSQSLAHSGFSRSEVSLQEPDYSRRAIYLFSSPGLLAGYVR